MPCYAGWGLKLLATEITYFNDSNVCMPFMYIILKITIIMFVFLYKKTCKKEKYVY